MLLAIVPCSKMYVLSMAGKQLDIRQPAWRVIRTIDIQPYGRILCGGLLPWLPAADLKLLNLVLLYHLSRPRFHQDIFTRILQAEVLTCYSRSDTSVLTEQIMVDRFADKT